MRHSAAIGSQVIVSRKLKEAERHDANRVQVVCRSQESRMASGMDCLSKIIEIQDDYA